MLLLLLLLMMLWLQYQWVFAAWACCGFGPSIRRVKRGWPVLPQLGFPGSWRVKPGRTPHSVCHKWAGGHYFFSGLAPGLSHSKWFEWCIADRGWRLFCRASPPHLLLLPYLLDCRKTAWAACSFPRLNKGAIHRFGVLVKLPRLLKVAGHRGFLRMNQNKDQPRLGSS